MQVIFLKEEQFVCKMFSWLRKTLKKKRFFDSLKNAPRWATACALVPQGRSQTAGVTSAPCGRDFLMRAFWVCTHQKRLGPSQRWQSSGRRVLCRADCAVHFASQVGWKTQGTAPWACMKSPHLGATSTGLSAPLSCRVCRRSRCLSTNPACHYTPHAVVPRLYHIPAPSRVQRR